MTAFPLPAHGTMHADHPDARAALLNAWWSVALAHAIEPVAPARGKVLVEMQGVPAYENERAVYHLNVGTDGGKIVDALRDAHPGLYGHLMALSDNLADSNAPLGTYWVTAPVTLSNHDILRASKFRDDLWRGLAQPAT